MFDAIIVGAGPAGLAAALTLGRARRAVLQLDSREYRNAPAAAVHNLIFHDGTPPDDLRQKGRAELALYPSVETRAIGATAARRHSAEEFELRLEDASVVTARRIVLATGLADELPHIDGLAELWGRSVFHCPYCHGYEVRDRSIGVLGAAPDRVRLAVHLTRFSRDVVLLANAERGLERDNESLLERVGIAVRREPVERFEGRDGKLEHLVFADGSSLTREAVFIRTALRQRSSLPAQLGCAAFEDGTVQVNDFGQTSVPGVYAVGDMARRASMPGPTAAVVAAAASGTIAAGAIDQDLLSADWGLANPFAAAARA